jgi:hypothetical protein
MLNFTGIRRKLCRASLILALAASVYRCDAPQASDPIFEAARQAARQINLSQSPLSQQTAQAFAAQNLSQISADSIDSEQLWALSQCNCAPRFAEKFLTRNLSSNGSLPQVLVPSIREEIQNNPSLKILNGLPEVLKGLGKALSSGLTNDEAIAESIRKGIVEKLNAAIPGGTRLQNQFKFRFDHFVGKQAPGEFDLTEQSSIWSYIWGRPEIWNSTAAFGYGDHGLQLLSVMRTMSEWNYAFGLQKSTQTQKPYGGLTTDPQNIADQVLQAYDPRESASAPVRIITGKYRISYAPAGAIDLATKGIESWNRTESKISLTEQSRLAYVAASAFARLRPEARTHVQAVFGSSKTSIFPPDAHQLALIPLSGFGALLNGGLIDPTSRAIFSSMRNSSDPNPAKASLLEVSRLLLALGAWHQQLSDVSGAQLDAENQTRLEAARPSLKLAAQNAVQTILADFVRYNAPSNPHGGFSLVMDQRLQLPDASTAAEVIATLIKIQAQGIDSKLLENRSAELLKWYFVQYLSSNNANTAPHSIFWIKSALDAFESKIKERPDMRWALEAQTLVDSIVNDWEQSQK